MRKAIFIFIAIVLVAASIDWIRSCSDLKSHKEVFGRELTYAEMYEYKDADYDYVVRIPSFFTAQPDSLQEENGSRIDGYSYYTKVVANHKLWFVYTMIYPDDYKDILARLFAEINDWYIWERPKLKIKQGESQTPKNVSE